MKYKFRFFALIIFLLMLFLNSCETENEVITGNYSGIKMSTISYSELSTLKPTAVSKLSKINISPSTSGTSRFVYNADYAFTVNMDNITLIETDKYHLLTFHIVRDNDNGKLENLILKSTPEYT